METQIHWKTHWVIASRPPSRRWVSCEMPRSEKTAPGGNAVRNKRAGKCVTGGGSSPIRVSWERDSFHTGRARDPWTGRLGQSGRPEWTQPWRTWAQRRTPQNRETGRLNKGGTQLTSNLPAPHPANSVPPPTGPTSTLGRINRFVGSSAFVLGNRVSLPSSTRGQ